MAWSISISGSDNLATKAEQVNLERLIRDKVAQLTRDLAKVHGISISASSSTTVTYGTTDHSKSVEK